MDVGANERDFLTLILIKDGVNKNHGGAGRSGANKWVSYAEKGRVYYLGMVSSSLNDRTNRSGKGQENL